MASSATRLITLSLLLGLVLLGPRVAGAADLVSSGSDFSSVYRFTPVTGTLNDLQVIYEGGFQFHPSNFGGITTFVLAGEALNPWEGRHTSQLLEESFDGGVWTARYRWSYLGDSLEFGLTARLDGKTLTEGGVSATLPPSGFLGVQGGEFLAYHAEVEGTLTDYICPAEDLCDTCPPGWEPDVVEPVPDGESGDETPESVLEPVPEADADAALDPAADDGTIGETEGEGAQAGGEGCSCTMGI